MSVINYLLYFDKSLEKVNFILHISYTFQDITVRNNQGQSTEGSLVEI